MSEVDRFVNRRRSSSAAAAPHRGVRAPPLELAPVLAYEEGHVALLDELEVPLQRSPHVLEGVALPVRPAQPPGPRGVLLEPGVGRHQHGDTSRRHEGRQALQQRLRLRQAAQQVAAQHGVEGPEGRRERARVAHLEGDAPEVHALRRPGEACAEPCATLQQPVAELAAGLEVLGGAHEGFAEVDTLHGGEAPRELERAPAHRAPEVQGGAGAPRGGALGGGALHEAQRGGGPAVPRHLVLGRAEVERKVLLHGPRGLVHSSPGGAAGRCAAHGAAGTGAGAAPVEERGERGAGQG
eukprot:CAMPEP_0183815008 /NCGR_PEP_ID=MMETSP0803_2-20130417/56067_1 /TAXON_ID=195967 /ORGANISM="Crustomastix stigmata, Strain CCMP3273" /LENGTH=295 /DNA_ID=CAMNT_0026059873 /DNA_START=54 /DNA_END=938 /DNA_ORIENTATION=+